MYEGVEKEGGGGCDIFNSYKEGEAIVDRVIAQICTKTMRVLALRRWGRWGWWDGRTYPISSREVRW